MPATFADAGAYAEDPTFLRQVKVALMIAGGTVAVEDRSQYPDSTMFALRRSLAINVLQDPDRWARIFASVVQFDPRVRAAAPTADDPTPPPVDDMLLSAVIFWTWNPVAGAGAALAAEPPPDPVAAAGDVPLSAAGGLDAAVPGPAPVLVPHPVSGVPRLMGAPLGPPLDLRTEGDVEQVQLRRPIPPPGAPAGWPGVAPWQHAAGALQRPSEGSGSGETGAAT